MPKLGSLSGAEVVAIMEQHDFVQARQKGSHKIMQKMDESGTITVPVPMHSRAQVIKILA